MAAADAPKVSYRPYETSDPLPALRTADRIELTACGYKTPEDGIAEALIHSDITWTLLVSEEPIGFFGVRYTGKVGVPWLLTGPGASSAPLAFVKRSKRVVKRMFELEPECEVLQNMTWRCHLESIRWLMILGFTFDYSKLIKLNGITFVPFHLLRPE